MGEEFANGAGVVTIKLERPSSRGCWHCSGPSFSWLTIAFYFKLFKLLHTLVFYLHHYRSVISSADCPNVQSCLPGALQDMGHVLWGTSPGADAMLPHTP